MKSLCYLFIKAADDLWDTQPFLMSLKEHQIRNLEDYGNNLNNHMQGH